jgi:hypothetical protein
MPLLRLLLLLCYGRVRQLERRRRRVHPLLLLPCGCRPLSHHPSGFLLILLIIRRPGGCSRSRSRSRWCRRLGNAAVCWRGGGSRAILLPRPRWLLPLFLVVRIVIRCVFVGRRSGSVDSFASIHFRPTYQREHGHLPTHNNHSPHAPPTRDESPAAAPADDAPFCCPRAAAAPTASPTTSSAIRRSARPRATCMATRNCYDMDRIARVSPCLLCAR